MGELLKLRLDLYKALRDMMGEPEFSKWFVNTFREKLAEVKESRSDRDRSVLRRLDTGDLSRTASFEAVRRSRGGMK